MDCIYLWLPAASGTSCAIWESEFWKLLSRCEVLPPLGLSSKILSCRIHLLEARADSATQRSPFCSLFKSPSSPESPLSPWFIGILESRNAFRSFVFSGPGTQPIQMNVHFVTVPPRYLPLKSAQDCTFQCSIPLTVQMDSFIWLNFHKRVQGKKLKYKTWSWRDISLVEWALLPGLQSPACTVGGSKLAYSCL